MRVLVALATLALFATIGNESSAQSSADEMARKLQNPLANIKALMTDNAIGFDTGDDDGTSYSFQLQPVYAVDLPDQGFTLIPRAVIPLVGLEPGTGLPYVGRDGNPSPSGGGSVWGLSDSMVQLFVAPHIESNLKFGFGPQFSLATHTQDDLQGPDWGAGVTGIVTGSITENVSFSAIIGNHWSFDGEFNQFTLHPTVFYNVPGLEGVALSYNAPLSIDWEASSSDRWTVPLGFTVSKTLALGGSGLDLSLGPYYNVARPSGAARWQLRFGITLLFD